MSLTIDNITFGYGIGRRKRIFTDFSGSIKKGKVTALLGSNGTGKTTLLKLCCGLLIPAQGSVQTGDSKISKREKRALEQIFFVPDTLVLPRVTAKKFIELNRPFYKSLDIALYFSLLKRFNVKEDVKLTNMSFGQQKKVYLAFALAARTSYVLLDEPTNGLDPMSMDELKKMIAECAHEERTIVISTHHLKEIENLCDDFMILDDAHNLTHLSLDEILKRYQFGLGDSAPSDSIYAQEGFGRYTYIRKRSGDDAESLFNLSLYMSAVVSKKLIP